MAKSTKPKPERTERQESPQGRETPSMGPRNERAKVQPLEAEPAIDRQYEPRDEHKDDNPWQDPGGAEPANG